MPTRGINENCKESAQKTWRAPSGFYDVVWEFMSRLNYEYSNDACEEKMSFDELMRFGEEEL